MSFRMIELIEIWVLWKSLVYMLNGFELYVEELPQEKVEIAQTLKFGWAII